MNADVDDTFAFLAEGGTETALFMIGNANDISTSPGTFLIYVENYKEPQDRYSWQFYSDEHLRCKSIYIGPTGDMTVTDSKVTFGVILQWKLKGWKIG